MTIKMTVIMGWYQIANPINIKINVINTALPNAFNMVSK
jgi:hypothetical protein